MPQLNKGGKFIFGRSIIQDNLTVRFPEQAIQEYDITAEGKIYLFTGSKSTGGFCVTRRGLLEPSKLGHILTDLPALRDYQIEPGDFLPYKGRAYCWIPVSEDGVISLTDGMLDLLNLQSGIPLLSIRSSDIAFTMGAKGPLVEKAAAYQGEIAVYE